jgi:hypothetical protein
LRRSGANKFTQIAQTHSFGDFSPGDRTSGCRLLWQIAWRPRGRLRARRRRRRKGTSTVPRTGSPRPNRYHVQPRRQRASITRGRLPGASRWQGYEPCQRAPAPPACKHVCRHAPLGRSTNEYNPIMENVKRCFRSSRPHPCPHLPGVTRQTASRAKSPAPKSPSPKARRPAHAAMHATQLARLPASVTFA